MLVMLVALAQAAASAPPPEIWTNEEEVYFAKEAEKAAPPWLALRVTGDAMVAVDVFGAPTTAPKFTAKRDRDAMRVTLADGTTTTLRRGRPVTCWASVKREKAKADGSEDWSFQPGIHIQDQGGRARVGGEGAPQAVIRMRNVVWPSGPNRPSLVLYIHTPDQPDRAVSYAWADPNAARVGINLRWIQASCTIDGREAPSPALKESKP